MFIFVVSLGLDHIESPCSFQLFVCSRLCLYLNQRIFRSSSLATHPFEFRSILRRQTTRDAMSNSSGKFTEYKIFAFVWRVRKFSESAIVPFSLDQ